MWFAALALLAVLQDPAPVTAARGALAEAEASDGVDSLPVADAASHLGNRLVDAGHFTEAIAAFDRALRIRVDRLGEGHAKTRIALSNLANAHMANCEAALALPLLDRAIQRAAGEVLAGNWGGLRGGGAAVSFTKTSTARWVIDCGEVAGQWTCKARGGVRCRPGAIASGTPRPR